MIGDYNYSVNLPTLTEALDIEICTDLVPTYLKGLPFDRTGVDAGFTDYDLGYNISADANNNVTVSAASAQLSETISVTR